MPKRKKDGRRGETQPESPRRFTATQGQYLAYLYWYRRLHRYSPAESEIADYFRVSPPSAHQMIVKLEERGLITRDPGTPRSVQVTVPRSEIPDLEGDEEETAVRVDMFERDEGTTKLYTLQVFLIGGEKFGKFTGREISRTILIRGDQTLEVLHQAIFKAYDRWDEHFYEFQFGSRPHDPKGKRYVLPELIEQEGDESNIVGELGRTTLDSLGLKVGQPFGYWFDYGDDWWHQINVLTISDEVPKGKYPKVTARVGKSPPQYPPPDEED